MIRYPTYGELYGQVLAMTCDRRYLAVYLPLWNSYVNVPRRMVLPVEELPLDFMRPHSMDTFRYTEASEVEGRLPVSYHGDSLASLLL